MKIYLAGKIANMDWRHQIVSGLNDVFEYYPDDIPDWPILKNSIGDFPGKQHDYTGPYFIRCGHGTSHGDNQHGSMDNPNENTQRVVFERCKQAIRNSDLIFAWIETPDCFGTIAELGYAHALGKTICIGGLKHIPDLWFVYSMAKHVAFRNDFDPGETYLPGEGWHIPFVREFLLWCANGYPNHREYINSYQWHYRAEIAKNRAGWRCQICNRHKSQVTLDAHHRTYERLGWERLDDITVLCRDCHELFEQNKREQRATRTAQPQSQRKNYRKR